MRIKVEMLAVSEENTLYMRAEVASVVIINFETAWRDFQTGLSSWDTVN